MQQNASIKHAFFIVILLLAGCATGSGSSIVVGEVREVIDPNQVELYLEIPESFEIIGIVTASSGSGWNEQGSVDYAVEELRNQAAKLGANGVLIESTGSQTSTVVGCYGTGYLYAVPVTAKSVTGKAIYVAH
jgi:hypothetical protein